VHLGKCRATVCGCSLPASPPIAPYIIRTRIQVVRELELEPGDALWRKKKLHHANFLFGIMKKSRKTRRDSKELMAPTDSGSGREMNSIYISGGDWETRAAGKSRRTNRGE